MAMSTDEKLNIVIDAQNKAQAAFDDLNRQLDKADKKYSSFGDRVDAVGHKMKSVGKGMSLAITLPILALGASAANTLIRIEQLGAQTEAVLKSTGNAANVTKKQLDGMSQTLEKVTGVEAESVTQGQNMLLTFTKIKNGVGEGNDIFDQATKAMLDMGTGMNGGVVPAGEQLKTTAIQLGKALNDPIKGVGALSKVGVQFTKDQKEQIKTMVESGDVMGAQKIILAELNTQFGGSAEAFGATTAGKVAKLKNNFGNVTEELAANFLPTVIQVVDKVSGMMQAFTKLSAEKKKFIYIALGVVAALGPIIYIVGLLITSITFLISPMGLIVAALALMAVGLVVLYKKSEKFRQIVAQVGEVIGTAFGDMVAVFKKDFLPAIQELWTKAQPILKVLGVILGVVVVGAIMIVINVLKYVMLFISNVLLPVIYVLGDVLHKVFTAIATVVKWAWENVIKPIWDLIYWYVTTMLIPVWSKLWDAAKVIWEAISAQIKFVWNNIIKPIWDLIWAYITNVLVPVWTKIWEAVKAAWDFMKPIFESIWAYITETLVPVFQKIWDKVSDVFTKVWEKISGFVDSVKEGFDKVKGWITSLIDKFVGIKDKVTNAFTTIGDAIKAPFKTAFNWIADGWNKTLGKLSFTIPDWVPNIGGKKFDMPNMPKLYKGVRDFSGGMAVVGDVAGRGGEIISMPQGSDVFNNRESKQILRNLADGNMSGSGTVTNTFTGNIYLGDASAVKEFFAMLDRQGELAAMGVPA